MRPDFELLAAFLVHVRRAVHGEALDMGWQRDRSADPRTRALGRVDDLLRAVVQHAVIVGLKPDADILVVHLNLPRVPQKRAAPHLSAGRHLSSNQLGSDACDDAGTNGAATFANGEA